MSIYTSLLTAGVNSHQESSENANALGTDFFSAGVVGAITNTSSVAPMTGAYGVNAQGSPNMTVAVSSGIAWVTATPGSQNSQLLRVRNTASTNVTISANASGSTKWDWLYLQVDATKAANPASDASDVATLVTSRSSSSTTDNGTPPTYGLLLAVITVANGASSITNGNIADKRVAAAQNAPNSSATTGWNLLSSAVSGALLTYSANNGNKEFVLTSNVDTSGVLSPGMKLKLPRSTTPPTQAMSFTAASSQYATRASPTGITFTGAFTCEAWVYLNSYTNVGMIIDRMDTGGTNGWDFYINSSGQIVIDYVTSSSHTTWSTYQSVPLKRWVHIAAAVSSVSSKTLQGIYINALSVPTQSTASAATTLTQTGNLTIGANNIGGTPANFFDGYIAEARVWSVAQSQANIQANMAINLVGNETNLVALFQGPTFNDLTSNANNLTATNGATQVTSYPYNATEYAFVTKVASGAVTVFTGTDYTIPNMTLSSPSYSTSRAPYGFPASRGKWVVTVRSLVNDSTASPTSGTWVESPTLRMSIPTGEWNLGYQVSGLANRGTSGLATTVFTASPTSAAETDVELSSIIEISAAVSGAVTSIVPVVKSKDISLTTQTTYYFNYKAGASGMTLAGTYNADGGMSKMDAVCAYI